LRSSSPILQPCRAHIKTGPEGCAKRICGTRAPEPRIRSRDKPRLKQRGRSIAHATRLCVYPARRPTAEAASQRRRTGLITLSPRRSAGSPKGRQLDLPGPTRVLLRRQRATGWRRGRMWASSRQTGRCTAQGYSSSPLLPPQYCKDHMPAPSGACRPCLAKDDVQTCLSAPSLVVCGSREIPGPSS